MAPRGFCFLVLGLAPIALTACVEPAPAAADATSLAPNIGIDLGSSARVRHVAGLAGEGEGFGRTEPGAIPAAHGSMPGMSHGSMGGMQMDHGSMPGMRHRSTGGMQMADAGHSHAQGTGTVNSIDAAGRKVNVS